MLDEPFTFTPAQEAAMQQIIQIAASHFDGGVITLMRTNPDRAAQDHIKTTTVGGIVQAYGLAHVSLRILDGKFSSNPPPL